MSFHSRSASSLSVSESISEEVAREPGRTVFERGEALEGDFEVVRVGEPTRVVQHRDVGCTTWQGGASVSVEATREGADCERE